MTQIFLVRHGERKDMSSDSPLSTEGKLQAKKLGLFFKKIPLDAIYVSDLTRAKETAAAIRKYHSKTPFTFMSELREVHSSLVGGKMGQDEPRRKLDTKRADAIFKKLLCDDSKKRVLIVAHGNLIKYFLAKSINIVGANLWHQMHLDTASITLIEVHKKGNSYVHIVKVYNDINHLGKDYSEMFYTKKYSPMKE